MSFQDRFRDRAEHVGKDGNRVAPPQASPLSDPGWLLAGSTDGGGVVPTFQQTRSNTFTHAIATGGDSGAGATSPLSQLGADSSVSGRTRHVKPPLPDFHEIALVQFGRRAGQAPTQRPPVLVDHPVTGNYHQHGLQEYKEMLEEYNHHRFGGLGAEDNEEKRRAREKRRKVFQYGDAVTSVNAAVMDATGEDWHNRPIEKRPTAEALLAIQKRERAQKYAEHVAPRPPPRRLSPIKALTPQPVSNNASLIDEQLISLEEKHKRDLEAIARIKKQLNLA